MTVKPIPDGFHTATPHLIVKNAPAAIEFYKKAFGAEEMMRLTDPSGRIAHAEIKIGDSPIMIGEEFPDWGSLSPQSLAGSPVIIHLYVEDPDGLADRSVAAGGKVLIPVNDQFYGDRAGRVEDPFGHIWVIAARKQEMTTEEMQRRFEDFLKQVGDS